MNKLTRLHRTWAIALLAAPTGVLAQAGPMDLEQRFWLQAQVLNASLDTSAQASSGFGATVGTRLALEDEFGLARRKSVPVLSGGMRIGQRWRMEIETLELKRSGPPVKTTRAISILESTYPVGTDLRATFNLQSTRFGAGYSAYQSETAEFGLVFGLLSSAFKFGLEAANLPNGGSGFAAVTTQTQTDLLAMLGVSGRWALAPDWILSARLETGRDPFGGGSDATASNASVNLAWRATPQVALSVGLRHFRGEIDFRDGFIVVFNRTQASYKFSGVTLGVSVGF
jgi:hypothetical protein